MAGFDRPVSDTLVGSVFVIMLEIFLDHVIQVLLPEADEVVETLPMKPLAADLLYAQLNLSCLLTDFRDLCSGPRSCCFIGCR